MKTHLKKTLIIESKNELLKVNINTERDYFSVTGLIYVMSKENRYNVNDGIYHNNKFYELISGGCIHNEILKKLPNLKIIVDLHSRDLNGIPMHCLENGFYYFERIAEYKQVFKDHFRLTEKESSFLLKKLKSYKNKTKSKLYLAKYINNKLVDRWKDQANKAIEIINNLK